MPASLPPLDATYQTRAVPAGTPRYWSWLFAAAESRAPLLGIYALHAEWQALMDPATEISVAHLKLAWWQEEMQRLNSSRSAVHPISAYLAALPNAHAVDLTPLTTAVNAAANQVGGAPLERGADLDAQSRVLWGNCMAVAAQLARNTGAGAGTGSADAAGILECATAWAAGDYLARGISDYRRDARFGRVPFAIDELLAAGVDNADLAADTAPPHLQNYLEQLRQRAAQYFEVAAHGLPRAQQSRQRHLLVLAALGKKHLNSGTARPGRRRIADMLLAWTTARRANANSELST